MRIRWPFVRRRTHDLKVAQLLGQVADYVGKLALATLERQRLERELDRLREHFDATCKAKDEAYTRLAAERDGFRDKSDILDRVVCRLDDRLAALGQFRPYDWAAPLPYWMTSVVTATIEAEGDGVRGTIAGFADDPASDDPRRNLSLPMGLSACPRPANNG